MKQKNIASNRFPSSLLFSGIILTALLLFSCASSQKKQTFPAVFNPENPSTNVTVLFYGSFGCYHCQQWSAKFQKDQIPYQFFEVMHDEANNREMWEKLRAAGIQDDTAFFPILDINGTIFMSRDYDEFKRILKKNSR